MLSLALGSLPVQGIRTVYENKNEVYHPGHAAHHVTRLHRYEHEGIESMLEEEARWTQELEEGSLRGSSFLEEDHAADMENSDFVKLSGVQVRALQEHHRPWLSWLQTANDHTQGQKAQGNSSKYVKESPHAALVQKYKAFLTTVRQTRTDGLVPATGLSSLSSQYVGPIGVGTVVSPMGCVPKPEKMSGEANSSMLERIGGFFSRHYSKLPNAKVASSFEQACTVQDQSKVWVVFDTGSTNIWIASDLCASGPCQLAGRHRFNHSASATFKYPESLLQLSVQFGTGKITGPQAVDDFKIGPFTVYNQTFAMIETESDSSVFRDVPFEGIVGMAFDKMSANHVQPFFSSMIQQKALQKNEFAFYFSRDKAAGNALLWGGVDQKFYEGKLRYFPVVDPYYWSLKLRNFKIGNDTILGASDTYEGSANPGRKWKGPMAVVDTGTTFFTVDTDKFGDVMSKLPSGDCKGVSEKTHPPITISLEDMRGDAGDFVLTNKEYMTRDNGRCSPAFMQIDLPTDHGPGMILGDIFLRQWFAVFDRDTGKDSDAKIAFAKSSHKPEAIARIRELTADQPAFTRKLDNVQ